MLRCMSRMKQVKLVNLRNAPYCRSVSMHAQTAENVGLTLSLTSTLHAGTMYRHNTWAAGYRRLYYRVLTHVLQILDRGSGTVLASPCTREASIPTMMLRCRSRMKQVTFKLVSQP